MRLATDNERPGLSRVQSSDFVARSINRRDINQCGLCGFRLFGQHLHTAGLGRRKRSTREPLNQIDDQKQDNRAKCGRNNGANNASAEGQTEP